MKLFKVIRSFLLVTQYTFIMPSGNLASRYTELKNAFKEMPRHEDRHKSKKETVSVSRPVVWWKP